MTNALSVIFLILLTFVILLFTLRERVASVRKGDVSLSYYSMFQGEEIPDIVQKTNRHFANLFEVAGAILWRGYSSHRNGNDRPRTVDTGLGFCRSTRHSHLYPSWL